jgi:hypothetical protein
VNGIQSVVPFDQPGLRPRRGDGRDAVGADDAVPAGTLGVVVAPVRDLEHLGHVGALAGGRDSHAHRHVQGRLAREPLVAYGGERPRAGGDRTVGRTARDDEDELVAAVAEEQVDLADAVADPVRHLREHGVTARVPVGVVDALEVVDVEQAHRIAVARLGEAGEVAVQGSTGQSAAHGVALDVDDACATRRLRPVFASH